MPSQTRCPSWAELGVRQSAIEENACQQKNDVTAGLNGKMFFFLFLLDVPLVGKGEILNHGWRDPSNRGGTPVGNDDMENLLWNTGMIDEMAPYENGCQKWINCYRSV